MNDHIFFQFDQFEIARHCKVERVFSELSCSRAIFRSKRHFRFVARSRLASIRASVARRFINSRGRSNRVNYKVELQAHVQPTLREATVTGSRRRAIGSLILEIGILGHHYVTSRLSVVDASFSTDSTCFSSEYEIDPHYYKLECFHVRTLYG